jgi:monoamine oxidase
MDLWQRRQVMAAALAFPFAKAARADGVFDIDVAVVGAGAAGISAAKRLLAHRLRVVVLEARGRIGGRTMTDAATLGQPFDLGAHWLHVAHANPLVTEAQAMGLDLVPSDASNARLFDRAAMATEAEHTAFRQAAARLQRRAILPSLIGQDQPMSSLARTDDPWEMLALTAPMIEMGAEPKDISLHDYSALATGDDLVVEGGYGALIAALAAGIDVRLNAVVTMIRWQVGGGVQVEGPFGTIRARAVIVTVPTSILAGGTIRFSPDLPQDIQAAFADLPMCAFEKVGFALDRPYPDLPEYAVVPRLLADGRTHALHLSPDRQVATVITVADTARTLAAEGNIAKVAFGKNVLAEVIGSDVAVRRSLVTDWLGGPFAHGAYSHARIGATTARDVYQTVLAERIWFAGEAAAGPQAVTVGGAWISGRQTAEQIARLLRV